MAAHGADLGSAVERRGLLQDGSHEGVVALALSMSGYSRRLVGPEQPEEDMKNEKKDGEKRRT